MSENENNTGLPKLPPPPGLGKISPLPGINPPAGLPKTPAGLPNLPAGLPGLPSIPPAPVNRPATTTGPPSTPNPVRTPPVAPVSTPPTEEYTQSPVPEVNAKEFFNNAPHNPDNEENNEEPAPKKNLWGGGKKTTENARAKKPSKKPSGKANKKETNVNQHTLYGGQRKKVLYARIAVFSIIGILMVAGLTSFIPKNSNITNSDRESIMSQVRQTLNVTSFPRTEGEGTALAFTKTYLNYDPATAKERSANLTTYASESIIDSIDFRLANEENRPNTSGKQTITDGPYLVDSELFRGGTAALITTMSRINNGSWVYLEIPLYHNEELNTLSVSASPTFRKATSVAEVPAEEITTQWESDDSIVTAMGADIENYMSAWVSSDTSAIKRYLVKNGSEIKASREAQDGLGGALKFVSISNFTPELKEKPDGEPGADFYERNALVEVTLMEPTSGVVFVQTYGLTIRYVNDNWFIEDIKNITSYIDRDAKKPAQPSTETAE